MCWCDGICAECGHHLADHRQPNGMIDGCRHDGCPAWQAGDCYPDGCRYDTTAPVAVR